MSVFRLEGVVVLGSICRKGMKVGFPIEPDHVPISGFDLGRPLWLLRLEITVVSIRYIPGSVLLSDQILDKQAVNYGAANPNCLFTVNGKML